MEAQYRHGDLLIVRVDRLPEGVKPTVGLVLAEGEATGHAHRLEHGKLFTAENGDLYFSSEQPTAVVHEEHARIQFEAGVHRVVRQREYSPEEIRQVVD